MAVFAILASCYLQYGSMCNFGKLVALQLQLCSLQHAACCIAAGCLQSSSLLLGPPDPHFTTLWACCWVPVANQPAAICSVYCNTAAYEGPVQPNAAHRRPNAPPRCIISAPMQPKPIPMSPLATKFGTHGKPNYHPRTKNAPD